MTIQVSVTNNSANVGYNVTVVGVSSTGLESSPTVLGPGESTTAWIHDSLSVHVKEHSMGLAEKSYTGGFDWALSMLEQGARVTRKGWNGKGIFIFLVPGSKFTVNRHPLLAAFDAGTEIQYRPHIDMKTADDQVVPWVASQSDILAKDWGLA